VSSEVINLYVKRREREREEQSTSQVWACLCGSTDFHLAADGRVLCAGCEGVLDNMRWIWT
jgi:hypothetical protein